MKFGGPFFFLSTRGEHSRVTSIRPRRVDKIINSHVGKCMHTFSLTRFIIRPMIVICTAHVIGWSATPGSARQGARKIHSCSFADAVHHSSSDRYLHCTRNRLVCDTWFFSSRCIDMVSHMRLSGTQQKSNAISICFRLYSNTPGDKSRSLMPHNRRTHNT